MSVISNGVEVAIPLPIQIVIDDVGWWCGTDGSAYQQPYRTGIARDHVTADYEAIISLGQQLGMKPQAAMILCEWDTRNLLRTLPAATWMGEGWDNTRWVGPWLEEAAEIIRNGRDHIEVTLHGIGHEYWERSLEGEWEFTRAEWHDRAGNIRPRHGIVQRLDFFARLLEQHNLGAFPTSFVPCAFLHSFASEGEDGLAAILKSYGITFISTLYRTMFGTEHVQHGSFGFDAKVMTVDRGQDLQRWFSIGITPQGELQGPICGMHWPNLLHPDPARNEEIVKSWVDFLLPYNKRLDRILAASTAEFATQLAHHTCTTCTVSGNVASLDLTAFQKLPLSALNQSLAVKVLAPDRAARLRFTAIGAEIREVEDEAITQGTLYTLMLRVGSNATKALIEWHPI